MAASAYNVLGTLNFTFLWHGNNIVTAVVGRINISEKLGNSKLRITNVLTHFMPLVSFNISWKHQKTYGFLVWFSDVFRGYWKSPVAWNRLANRKKLLWFILCDLLLITSLELLTQRFFNISKCLDSIARKAHFSWSFHFHQV